MWRKALRTKSKRTRRSGKIALIHQFLVGIGRNKGQVAQSVEQWTENPRVGSSILPLATMASQAYQARTKSEPAAPANQWNGKRNWRRPHATTRRAGNTADSFPRRWARRARRASPLLFQRVCAHVQDETTPEPFYGEQVNDDSLCERFRATPILFCRAN